MAIDIDHLFRHPQHLPATARMIYDEFWVGVSGGRTVDGLHAHLLTATDPLRVPLSRIAIDGAELIGTVNLIDNDDDHRTHLRPWLAALVVRADRRGGGVGTRLVRTLLADAAQMRLRAVYLGTDGPGYYARLGASVHEQVNRDFCIMRFDLPG